MRMWWGAVIVAGLMGCGGSADVPPAQTYAASGGGGSAVTGSTSGSTSGSGSTSSSGSGSTSSSGSGGGGVIYPTPDWALDTPANVGIDAGLLEQAASIADAKQSYCLLVIRHGKLVFERYWRGHGQTTPERSWSIAKSYSSTLVGIAIARGDIGSIDDSVAKYIPAWKGTPNEAITVKNLVSMTSGMKWSAFDDYFTMALLAQDHSKHALAVPLDKTPGATWTYDNAAVQVLEPLFRSATGMTVEQYADKYLWSKIGETATWAHDPAGNPTTYASVMASCRDHARLGYLFLHGGVWEKEQVVPAAWVTASLTPSQPLNQAYGYLWWLNGHTPYVGSLGSQHGSADLIPFAPDDLFAAHGFGNQFVDVIPSLDLMVVRFGTDPMNTFDMAKLLADEQFETEAAILKPVLAAVKP